MAHPWGRQGYKAVPPSAGEALNPSPDVQAQCVSIQVGCNVERDLMLQLQAVSHTILGSL